MTSKKTESNKHLGIIGGGQLAQMLIQNSQKIVSEISVLGEENGPASSENCKYVIGSPLSFEDILKFGKTVDVITIELENVNVKALAVLEQAGKTVYPSPKIIKVIQDKTLQKTFFKNENIPTAPFKVLKQAQEFVSLKAEKATGFLKLARGGYDGRGVFEISNGQTSFNGSLKDFPILFEEKISILKEVSVIVARNSNGEIKVFDPTEMKVDSNLNQLDYLFCPSDTSSEQNKKLNELSILIVEKLNYVGLLAIEFFISKENGEVLVNELAPRPHNSGHHSIEACETSQFEQLLRSVLDLKLGDTNLRHTFSVMLNVLGEDNSLGSPDYSNLTTLSSESLFVHLYGKKEVRPGRKMGHVTIVSSSKESAEQIVKKIKPYLKVKGKSPL